MNREAGDRWIELDANQNWTKATSTLHFKTDFSV